MSEHSPQLENGYTRIANEWLEAFLGYKAPASLKDFVLAVARETWGWKTKLKAIPISRFERLLQVSNRRVYQLRREAVRHNLILFEGGEHSDVAQYGVQKEYLEWVEYNSPRPLSGVKHPLHTVAPDTVKQPVRSDTVAPATKHTVAPATPSKERTYKESTTNDPLSLVTTITSNPPSASLKSETAKHREQRKLEEEQQLLDEFSEEERELLDDYITSADEELKQKWLVKHPEKSPGDYTGGTTVGGRVARLKALIAVANEVDDPDAFLYGLHQANQARAPNPNYVKVAALSKRDRR